ncbi:MAG: MSCRAMM family protein, partial [Chitinophagaceae bacterium]
IIANFSSGSSDQVFHKPLLVTLRPFTDTLIQLKKHLNPSMFNEDISHLTIMGLFENGNIFGQADVEIQVMKSYRYLPDEEQPHYINSFNNSMTVSAQNLFSQSAYYNLMGGGVVNVPSGRVGFNLDADLRQNDLKNPYIRNTYISYESHNLGITAGDISRNFDLNIFGRGVALYALDTANKNYYETGYMDNAGSLLEKYNPAFPLGHTMWGTIRHQATHWQLQTVLLYQKDPFSKTGNILLTNQLDWTTVKHFIFSAQLNAGNTNEYLNPRMNKSGWSGSFSMNKDFGKLSISSSNTYSSPYYPGIKKGARILSERITYSKKKSTLWGSFNYYSYQPKFLNLPFNFASNYGSSKAALGWSPHLGAYAISISPYYSSEKSSQPIMDSVVEAKIKAWRLMAQLNYNSPKGNKSIGLNAETGIAQNSLQNNEEFQFKINSNFNSRFFNLTSNFQVGSFYPGEALNVYLQHLKHYKSIYITPMFQKNFLHNNLLIQAGLSYSYNTISRYNLSFTGVIQYQFPSQSLLSVNLVTNKNVYSPVPFNNLQVSYTNKIPEGRIGTKYNTLEVILYKDLNKNNVFDAGDSLAANQPININNDAFITDSRGMAEYQNLPNGSYNIYILPEFGWYAANQVVSLNKKKQTVWVALHKTGAVEGSIAYSFNQFSYQIDKPKLGIIINAMDNQGNITTTRTDNNGNFIFFLPAGTYTILVDPQNLPSEIECVNNNQKVNVTSDSYLKVSFLLRVKNRKLEIKKFNSSS